LLRKGRCEAAGHPPAYPLRVLRDCCKDQSPDESGSYRVMIGFVNLMNNPG